MKKLATIVAAAALSLTVAACGGENNDANIITDETTENLEQNAENSLNEAGNDVEGAVNEVEGAVEGAEDEMTEETAE